MNNWLIKGEVSKRPEESEIGGVNHNINKVKNLKSRFEKPEKTKETNDKDDNKNKVQELKKFFEKEETKKPKLKTDLKLTRLKENRWKEMISNEKEQRDEKVVTEDECLTRLRRKEVADKFNRDGTLEDGGFVTSRSKIQGVKRKLDVIGSGLQQLELLRWEGRRLDHFKNISLAKKDLCIGEGGGGRKKNELDRRK